jgi:hypothetical protein
VGLRVHRRQTAADGPRIGQHHTGQRGHYRGLRGRGVDVRDRADRDRPGTPLPAAAPRPALRSRAGRRGHHRRCLRCGLRQAPDPLLRPDRYGLPGRRHPCAAQHCPAKPDARAGRLRTDRRRHRRLRGSGPVPGRFLAAFCLDPARVCNPGAAARGGGLSDRADPAALRRDADRPGDARDGYRAVDLLRPGGWRSDRRHPALRARPAAAAIARADTLDGRSGPSLGLTAAAGSSSRQDPAGTRRCLSGGRDCRGERRAARRVTGAPSAPAASRRTRQRHRAGAHRLRRLRPRRQRHRRGGKPASCQARRSHSHGVAHLRRWVRAGARRAVRRRLRRRCPAGCRADRRARRRAGRVGGLPGDSTGARGDARLEDSHRHGRRAASKPHRHRLARPRQAGRPDSR